MATGKVNPRSLVNVSAPSEYRGEHFQLAWRVPAKALGPVERSTLPGEPDRLFALRLESRHIGAEESRRFLPQLVQPSNQERDE